MRRRPGVARLSFLRLAGGLLLFAAEGWWKATSFLVPHNPSPEISFRSKLAALVAARSPIRAADASYGAVPASFARRPLLVRLLSSTYTRNQVGRLSEGPGPKGTTAPQQATRSAASLPYPRMPVLLSPGDGVGGEGLHWAPSDPNATLIFMHGLGDTAAGWSEMLQLLESAQLHHKTRLVMPTAPVRPVTLNLGMRMTAWSDIRGLTEDANEDREGLLASKKRIDGIIESEIKRGIHPSRIVVGGFSQGAAMAYLVGLTSPHKLGGILALSGWCPLGKEIQVSEHYTDTIPSILHCHGADDDLVRPIYGQTSVESIRNRLMDSGASPERCHEQIVFKLYQGLGHSANTQELSDARIFLSKALTYAQAHMPARGGLLFCYIGRQALSWLHEQQLHVCNDSCSDLDLHLVLPLPPDDEEATHADFRASLFEALGLEVTNGDLAISQPRAEGGPSTCPSDNLSSRKGHIRLLRVCSCLCDRCLRVSCGAWLDALRVNEASDSELYFFQGQLHMASKINTGETTGLVSMRKRRKDAKCFRWAEGREEGTREEAWGLLAGCAGPFSFRHSLTKMMKPPEMLALLADGALGKDIRTEEAAARYAAQGRRLFSLFCAPANVVKRSSVDEHSTAVLCASASELGAYIHPSVQVAIFEGEGRGLLAAGKLQQGDLLLRMPATTLVNVYTALAHPTFSPLAQLLLGLPVEHLQEAAESIRGACGWKDHQRQPEETQELQPLVDCDVVVCSFLLFLAFAAGQEGGKALLRFLPPASAADAAATAEVLSSSPTAATTATATAEKEILLLSDPESVVQFLGDEALADAMNRTIAKCHMMHQQLLPLLKRAFPPPYDIREAGVLASCRSAAKASAGKAATTWSHFSGGAVAAAAEVAAATGAPVGSSLKGNDLLCAFVSHLSYDDFLWAHMVLDSRSFSLLLGPPAPVTELPGLAGPRQEQPVKDNGNAEEERDGGTEDELTVPFHPDLCGVPPLKEACAVVLPVGASGDSLPRFHVRIPRRCASLVPLGELLNHHPHGQVLSPSLEEEGRWLCLRMACDVPAGAQVYAHYGPLQSWQFLGYFGFCPSSFPHLQPPQQLLQQAPQNTSGTSAAGSEWLFTGETPGNPVDFLALQVEIASDDAELELKKGLMELQSLPFYGIFSTGAETIPWKFLASLFVSSHTSLDRFLSQSLSGNANTPAAAAAAAGESAWGPVYTFSALQNDASAAQNIRKIISGVLQSVADRAQERTRQLDAWSRGAETAPDWTWAWGDRVRVYLQNQIALATRQMEALNRVLPP